MKEDSQIRIKEKKECNKIRISARCAQLRKILISA
jgi:hypothetical protein